MTSRASGEQAGRAGLALTAVSIAATFTVAVLGPSVMEPALPGQAGQPPWAFTAHPSPYLVVALTAFAIAAGTGRPGADPPGHPARLGGVPLAHPGGGNRRRGGTGARPPVWHF